MISSEDVPHLGLLALDQPLRALDRLHVAAVLELADDERLEQLERHVLGQAALVQLELGTDHDHRTARVVHALAEQVLAEPALLALQHVAERLERPVALPAHRAAATAVVEQRVHRLLQHALLVAQDDLGRLDVHELLEAVVAVDHATVQVVEVRGREPPALERHQRAQVRRQHRHALEDHPLGTVAAVAERLDDAEALERLLLALHRGLDLGLGAQVGLQLLEVELREQVPDRLGAHLRLEARVRLLLDDLVVLVLGDDLLLLEPGGARVDHHVRLVVQDALEVTDAHVEQVADARRDALEEPDVRNGHRQLDVAEPLAAHLRLRHFHAAAVADHAAVADALVLAAVALPVLDRPEDLLAEQAVLLGLERAVVDGFGLRHLAVRPAAHDVGRRQPDPDGIERGATALLVLLQPAQSQLAGGHAQRRLQFGVLDHRLSLGTVPGSGAAPARAGAASRQARITLLRTGLPGRGSGVPSRAR